MSVIDIDSRQQQPAWQAGEGNAEYGKQGLAGQTGHSKPSQGQTHLLSAKTTAAAVANHSIPSGFRTPDWICRRVSCLVKAVFDPQEAQGYFVSLVQVLHHASIYHSRLQMQDALDTLCRQLLAATTSAFSGALRQMFA